MDRDHADGRNQPINQKHCKKETLFKISLNMYVMEGPNLPVDANSNPNPMDVPTITDRQVNLIATVFRRDGRSSSSMRVRMRTISGNVIEMEMIVHATTANASHDLDG